MIHRTFTTRGGEELPLEIPAFWEVLEATIRNVAQPGLKEAVARLLERALHISLLKIAPVTKP